MQLAHAVDGLLAQHLQVGHQVQLLHLVGIAQAVVAEVVEGVAHVGGDILGLARLELREQGEFRFRIYEGVQGHEVHGDGLQSVCRERSELLRILLCALAVVGSWIIEDGSHQRPRVRFVEQLTGLDVLQGGE